MSKLTRQIFFDMAIFSKKLINNFFEVIATSKNFDVTFFTKLLTRQKLSFFFCSDLFIVNIVLLDKAFRNKSSLITFH
jgi:hypothetical protein